MSGNNLQAGSDVAKMLDNCVRNGLLLSASLKIPLIEKEKADLRWVLLGRLLYELLRPKEAYPTFMLKLSRLPASIVDCFNSLRKFVKFEEPTMVVLHFDETKVLNESTLEVMDRCALESFFDSNVFFVVIQTGVRTAMMQVLPDVTRTFRCILRSYGSFQAAAKANSQSMPTLIPLPLLNETHLQEITCFLIDPHAPKKVRLNPFFVELISYCSGNPRYLEFVLMGLSAKPEFLKKRMNVRPINLAVLRSQNASTSLESFKSDVMDRVRFFLVKVIRLARS